MEIYINIMEFYREELIHALMEAEKSYDLLFAVWRTRRAGGIIQSES